MKNLPLFFLFVLIVGCNPYSRVDLTIDKTNNIGEYFRTDGFYYAVNDTFGREPLTYVIIFFGNGNIYGDYWSSESPDMITEYFALETNYKNALDIVYYWGGVKLIEDKQVLIESWKGYTSWYKYVTKKYSVLILNDTTLLMLDHKYVDTLHFMPLTYKPDSIPPFNSVSHIAEGDFDAWISYGPDQQRNQMRITDNGVAFIEREYISPLFERDRLPNGQWRNLSYIQTPHGTEAVYVVNEQTTAKGFYYLMTDYQNTILAVTDPTGTLLEEYSFDAWGNRRNIDNWRTIYTNTDNPDAPVSYNQLWHMYRGYTGHEHLDCFALINMNGRLYDPIVGRMLSPDNYVSNLNNTQNYNRYSYALNNPLKYTDPDGENPVFHILASVVLNVGVNGLSNSLNNRDFFYNAGTAALKGVFTGLSVYSVNNPNPRLGQTNFGLKSIGQIAKSVFINYIPPLNINVADGVTLSLSPSVYWVGNGWGIGANAGVTVESGNVAMSVYTGATYGVDQYTQQKGFTYRVTGVTAFSMINGTLAASSTEFIMIGGPYQRVGGLHWNSLNGLDFSYENDGVPFAGTGPFLTGDGGDHYRTAAVSVGKDDVKVGMNIFTGWRNMNSEKKYDEFPNQTVVNNPEIDQYLSGLLFMQVGHQRLGINHYLVGHVFQNLLAHTLISPQAWIPWVTSTNRPQELYGGFFYGNPYTNW